MHARPLLKSVLPVLLLVTSAAALSAPDPALTAALANPVRKPAAVARDPVRHPVEELTFFGLAPDQTVVEIWPGAGYWTDILAPYVTPHGRYYVVLPAAAGSEWDGEVKYWHEHFEGKPAYTRITVTGLGPKQLEIAPAGSADLVLTFRNLHNWMDGGYALEALQACFKALKPGGILGIEEHRGRNDQPQDPKAKNGYVRQDYTIELAKKAGFELVAASEINANPRDTKDWVDGVWTLPPTLSQGQKDRDRYLAVGEADNFVLKLRKPAH